jgi:hypothetical protein
MPTNLTEFADDTAFERYLLDRATPLLPAAQGTSVIELGESGSWGITVGAPPAIVRVSATDFAMSAKGQLSTNDIRPLLFGAAWKVLDQLCELGLEIAQVRHNAGWRYTIAFKVTEAASGRVAPQPPFVGRADIWSRIMLTYALTEELRNSLVHRRLVVDPSTGDIGGAAAAGQPAPRPATADEQSALCQVAAGAAEAVISGDLTTRRTSQLAWALDRLSLHHGQPPFGASPVQGLIPRAVVQASPGPSSELSLDFADVASRARAAVQGVSHYDVEIRLPDGRALTGALEDAPAGKAIISLAAPPTWLRWI